MLREALFRRAIRKLQRDLGAAHRKELRDNPFQDEALRKARPRHLLVEDCNASVTVFVFASSAQLFAGQPTFDFRGLLRPEQGFCNLVFLRDPHRMAYHVSPEDGSPNGLAFYENEVRELMQSLGGKAYLAIGDSAGGAAALYFGTRCGMDRVVAFSIPFPLSNWYSFKTLYSALTDLRLLRRSWNEWHEVTRLSVVSRVMDLLFRAVVGRKNIWDPVDTFLSSPKRPQLTIYFGEDCRPDAAIAHRLGSVPEARLVPLPTALHNSTLYLARKRQLRTVVEEGIAETAALAASLPAHAPLSAE